METSEIKNILIKQIETGSSAEYWVNIYDKEDLDALVSIEDTINTYIIKDGNNVELTLWKNYIWVMEKNCNQAEDFVKNYVFVRNCQNTLEIREDILKYIEETTTEQKTDYIEALNKYAYFLFNPYNDKETSIFNEEEKTKIFA